jgi:hypothetical protein
LNQTVKRRNETIANFKENFKRKLEKTESIKMSSTAVSKLNSLFSYLGDKVRENEVDIILSNMITTMLGSQSLSDEELIYHYANIGLKEGRMYKLPDDFNCKLYKEINEDLVDLNDNQLMSHYLINGIREKRIYNLPKNFNHNTYRKLNKDLTKFTDGELTKHYLFYGHKEKRPYK